VREPQRLRARAQPPRRTLVYSTACPPSRGAANRALDLIATDRDLVPGL